MAVAQYTYTHTNNTENDTKQTIHRTTQKLGRVHGLANLNLWPLISMCHKQRYLTHHSIKQTILNKMSHACYCVQKIFIFRIFTVVNSCFYRVYIQANYICQKLTIAMNIRGCTYSIIVMRVSISDCVIPQWCTRSTNSKEQK